MAPGARGRRHRLLERADPEGRPGAATKEVKRGLGAILSLAHALVASTAAGTELSTLLSAVDLSGYAAGERPPAFVGRSAQGSALSLTELHGRVVLLTFWA